MESWRASFVFLPGLWASFDIYIITYACVEREEEEAKIKKTNVSPSPFPPQIVLG